MVCSLYLRGQEHSWRVMDMLKELRIYTAGPIVFVMFISLLMPGCGSDSVPTESFTFQWTIDPSFFLHDGSIVLTPLADRVLYVLHLPRGTAQRLIDLPDHSSFAVVKGNLVVWDRKEVLDYGSVADPRPRRRWPDSLCYIDGDDLFIVEEHQVSDISGRIVLANWNESLDLRSALRYCFVHNRTAYWVAANEEGLSIRTDAGPICQIPLGHEWEPPEIRHTAHYLVLLQYPKKGLPSPRILPFITVVDLDNWSLRRFRCAGVGVPTSGFTAGRFVLLTGLDPEIGRWKMRCMRLLGMGEDRLVSMLLLDLADGTVFKLAGSNAFVSCYAHDNVLSLLYGATPEYSIRGYDLRGLNRSIGVPASHVQLVEATVSLRAR